MRGKQGQVAGLGESTSGLDRRFYVGRDIVAVDFDGVICQYVEGPVAGEFGDVIPGAKRAIAALRSMGRKVIVYTVREEIDLVLAYLDAHGILVDGVTNRKPRAHVYVDDRAITFNGNWDSILPAIVSFEPYYYRKDSDD